MKLAETPLFRVTAAIAAVAVAHYFINLIHYCNKTIWNAQQQLRQHWGNTEETIKKEKQHWSNIEASSSSMTQQKEQE